MVATAKSGALGEVLAPRDLLDEAMATARGFARRADCRLGLAAGALQSGAIVAAIVIGDRAGLDIDVHAPCRRAGTYQVTDFRREHRDPRRTDCSARAGSPDGSAGRR